MSQIKQSFTNNLIISNGDDGFAGYKTNKGDQQNNALKIMQASLKGFNLLSKPEQELMLKFQNAQERLLKQKKGPMRNLMIKNLNVLVAEMEKSSFTFAPDDRDKNLFKVQHPCFILGAHGLAPAIAPALQGHIQRERAAQEFRDEKQDEKVDEVSANLAKLGM